MERESHEPLRTEQEAAHQLNLSPKTLEGWRTRGGGPKFVRLGTRAVRYRPADLNEFVERGLRTSTASEPCPKRVQEPGGQHVGTGSSTSCNESRPGAVERAHPRNRRR